MQSPSRSVLTVLDNVPFGDVGQRSFFALTLERPAWDHWLPGQFAMLRPTSWSEDMTWARPLSICRVTADRLVFFFQVVGRGTARMAKLRTGDSVTVWGPLGVGFSREYDVPTLLLAGGIGIAPFAGYVDSHPRPAGLSMLFGHRLALRNYPAESLAQRIDLESVQERNAEELAGFQLRVKERMAEFKRKDGLALACGPLPFLRMIWQYARELDLRTQVSLDQRMACGVGACLGCVTGTTEHWPEKYLAGLPVQTCTKGPVFWAREVDLEAAVNGGANGAIKGEGHHGS